MFSDRGRSSSPPGQTGHYNLPMQSGTCPSCTRPYTVSEISGFGILRGRPPDKGGPYMEFTCPGCKRVLRLVPHGDGRYAPPGEPPPPAPPVEERLPPWLKDQKGRRGRPPEPEREPAAQEPAQARASGPPPTHDVEVEEPETEPEERPIGLREALELLGVDPGADMPAIEKAFRERSRTCHPDKVAHLDLEFQELAERKFKRLQQAVDLLRS